MTMHFLQLRDASNVRVHSHTHTSTGAGTVRGKRHGDLDLVGGFSDADPVMAYKLLHKMSADKQLTKNEVHLCACTCAQRMCVRQILLLWNRPL